MVIKQLKDKSTFRNDEKTLKMYDDVFLLNYLVLNTLGTTEKSKDDPEVDKEAIEKLTNDMITKIVEINADMPLEDVKKMIGEKTATTDGCQMSSWNLLPPQTLTTRT